MAHLPEGRSRRVGRLKLNEAQGLRQKILDAAVRLFRRHGYAGTSIEAIATAAGISKRSVYSRFANKTVLFTTVIETVVQQIVAPPIGRSEAALVPMLAEAADRLARPQIYPIMLAILQLVTLDSEPQQDLAAAARFVGLAPVVKWLGDLLQAQGVAATDDARRRLLAETLFALMVIGPRLGVSRPGKSDPLQLARAQAELIEVFVAGCLPPGRAVPQAATDREIGASEAAVKAPPDR